MSERKLPDTSISAHKQSKELSTAHKAKILEALSQVEYANYEVIADMTGIDKHGVGRRISELIADGKIYRTTVKIPTKTNREAYCLAIIGKGGLITEPTETKPVKRQKKPVEPDKKTITVRSYERRIRKAPIPTQQNKLF